MKYILTILLVSIISFAAKAQNNQATLLADKIAQKMKDSLSLTAQQKSLLYQINMDLHQLKVAMRQQYSSPDSLQVKLQKIENRRDSLYRPVLTEEQFLLYRQKKYNLVNNQ